MIPLKVLFVATEAAPFMKVGGLGEVMFSLPVALRQLGHDARVMIPRYASIDTTKFPMTMVKEGLQVPSGYEQPVICNVKALDHAFFLENQEYYEKRANVYGYDDDAVRWALLCRGTIEFIRANEEWRPDVIVACDWQGGLLPNYIDHQYKDDPIISKFPSCFDPQSFYQGMFDHNFVSEMDYDDGQSEIPFQQSTPVENQFYASRDHACGCSEYRLTHLRERNYHARIRRAPRCFVTGATIASLRHSQRTGL